MLALVVACDQSEKFRKPAERLLPPGAEVLHEKKCGGFSPSEACLALYFRHSEPDGGKLAQLMIDRAVADGWRLLKRYDFQGRGGAAYFYKDGLSASIAVGPDRTVDCVVVKCMASVEVH